MSRIGKKSIPVPENIKYQIGQGTFEATGPKGTVKQVFPKAVTVEYDEQTKSLQIKRHNDSKQSKAFHGLTRMLIANVIFGVTEGFKKILQIEGQGYNAKLKGKHIELQVGFCLPKVLMIPDGITVEIPMPTKIVVNGSDKCLVGQFAANIRAIRPPDSFQGKGIRYQGEVVKLKAGKSVS